MFEELAERERRYSPEVQTVSAGMPSLPLLTVKEVAAGLGYSSEYVRRLVRGGEIKATPARGDQRENVRIYKISILDYLERNLRR